MDVIGPWQAGFQNVVATMGTSLTEQHVALLRRSATRIVLALDPDAAGMRAAERAGGLLLGLDSPEEAARSARSAQDITATGDIELRVAPLPPGKDPDEVARDDPDGWSRAISDARPFAEFLISRLMEQDAGDSPVEARRAIDRVRPILLAVRDPVERALYIQRIARHLGVSEQAVQERIGSRQARSSAAPVAEPRTPTQEGFLLAILLRFPELRARFGTIPPSFFTDAIDREVFIRWRESDEPSAGDDVDPVAIRWTELERLRLPPFTQERATEDIRQKVERIKRERDIAHMAAASERMAEMERDTGSAAVAAIASNAWRGVVAESRDREIAEVVLEVQQLGESMHRHEPQIRTE
jgi:DNA primase